MSPVDIICAGSPCQDLSSAGKRKGIEGERSGLFRKAVDIVWEMRQATNGKNPRWFVWENVPGAFSSNRGADFRTVLEEITKESIPMPGSRKWAKSGMVRGKQCDISWRVLDAQYWGVPQRRKRIFLIADFRAERRPEILFKPEGVSGDSEASTRARQGASDDVEASTGTSITLSQNMNATENTTATLKAEGYSSNPIVAIEGNGSRPSHKGDGYKEGDMMYTLNSTEVHGVATFATKSYTEIETSDVSATLKAKGGTCGGGSESYVVLKMASSKAVTGTLLANADTKLWLGNQEAFSGDYFVIEGGYTDYTVRRLTPLECERLQGLPDGFTDIEFKGKPATDSKRYKAIGNGMAHPCASFVLRQIAKAEKYV